MGNARRSIDLFVLAGLAAWMLGVGCTESEPNPPREARFAQRVMPEAKPAQGPHEAPSTPDEPSKDRPKDAKVEELGGSAAGGEGARGDEGKAAGAAGVLGAVGKGELSGLGSLGHGGGGLAGNSVGDATGAGGLGLRRSGLGSGSGSGGYGYVGGASTGRSGRGRARGGSRGTSFAASAPTNAAPPRDSTAGDSGNFAPREVPSLYAPTDPRQDRLSTFAVDVDTAAYSIARRTLNAGAMPEPSLVRLEELVNYFHYDYDPPSSAPFSIQVDGAESPVDASKYLLRIGLQARIVKDEDRMPANLVFLVDTSCSMTSADKLQLAQASLLIAIDRLDARDKVALTTYAGGVRLVLPPTSGANKRAIREAIRSLTTGGGTAMESGLELAYRQAAAMLRPGTVTRIIVCSDGDANIGATTHTDMLARVSGYVKEGVFLSTIGFGDGNYQDVTMEQLANRGNGNYFYVDGERQAQRVFDRDFLKMIQDVAKDVKIQVEMNPDAVKSYRLVGYENREVADRDFRNDAVDAGEIGAGHQVTAIYELELQDEPAETLVTVRVRAKAPTSEVAQESARVVQTRAVRRAFAAAPVDLRFAAAVMGGAELLRHSPHAAAWSYDRVVSIIDDTGSGGDPDRMEWRALMQKARALSGSQGHRITRR